ncbi:HTH domain-containing protein [Fictibacillus gelatini]|uniref:HTH domain-containing protein n=1 Tax=Fictibacillus gelatini TaxID=225985 RepID=UPI000405C4D6|nr:HTH domain-containing protein [Fictibacillus gelatini]
MEEVTLEDNIAKLKHKYKMSDELIDKILFSNSDSDYLHPINISTLLALIDVVDETERLCIIIETMHTNLGMSYETLASFGEIDTEELKRFLQKPETLTEKKKFVLAVRILFMHFVLKEKYTVETNCDFIND